MRTWLPVMARSRANSVPPEVGTETERTRTPAGVYSPNSEPPELTCVLT
jgi:hypothetical protein